MFYTLRVKRVIPTTDSTITRSGPAWKNLAWLRLNLQAVALFLGADLDFGAQVIWKLLQDNLQTVELDNNNKISTMIQDVGGHLIFHLLYYCSDGLQKLL